MNNIYKFSFLLLIFFLSFYLFKKETFHSARIISTLENANAVSINDKITRPVEKILFQIDDIKNISSTSLYGKSVIDVEIKKNIFKNPQDVWDRLRRKMENAKEVVPHNTVIKIDDEIDEVFDVMIALTDKENNYEKLFDAAQITRDEILKLKRRSRVEIKGQQQEVLYLYFNDSYFSNLKLTIDAVKKLIQEINADKGGGYISSYKHFFEINSLNEFISPDEIKKRIININNRSIKTGDIFKIEKTIKTPLETLVKINGKKGLILAVSKKKGANGFLFNKEIYKAIEKIKKDYKNFDVEIVYMKKNFIKNLLTDSNFYPVKYEIKNGADFNKTIFLTEKIEAFLKNNKNRSYISFMGTDIPKFNKNYKLKEDRINFAVIFIKGRNSSKEIQNYINKNLSDVIVLDGNKETKIRILSNNLNELLDLKENIRNKISKLKGVYSIQDDFGSFSPVFNVKADENSSVLKGISPYYIFSFLNGFYNGEILTYYYRNDIKIPVILKGEENKKIESLSLYSPVLKKVIPIGEIVKVDTSFVLSKIKRFNNFYSITFAIRGGNVKEIKKILDNTPYIKYEILKK